jgi:hypothetical protein
MADPVSLACNLAPPPLPVERLEKLSLREQKAVSDASIKRGAVDISGDSCSSLQHSPDQQSPTACKGDAGPVAPYQARPVHGPIITHNLTPAQPVLERSADVSKEVSVLAGRSAHKVFALSQQPSTDGL